MSRRKTVESEQPQWHWHSGWQFSLALLPPSRHLRLRVVALPVAALPEVQPPTLATPAAVVPVNQDDSTAARPGLGATKCQRHDQRRTGHGRTRAHAAESESGESSSAGSSSSCRSSIARPRAGDPVPVGVVLWRVNAGGSAIAVPANAGGTPALTPGIATSKLSLTQRGRLRAR